VYFFIVDWPRSFDSPFTDSAEAFKTMNSDKEADVKKVIIENN